MLYSTHHDRPLVTSSVVPLSFSAKMEGTDDVSETGLQLDVFQQALPNDEYLNP